MIKFENTEVLGWKHAIRGMRNPMNSWDKSDTKFYDEQSEYKYDIPYIGCNDLNLMEHLKLAGADHRKYLRMITVYVDITAPLYWWKEFDTYKVGTIANSCSTMHKIHSKEFTLEDFSYEHLIEPSLTLLKCTIENLNTNRMIFLEGGEICSPDGWINVDPKSKDVWWQMIQLLPSSYNQKRTIMLNYEILNNIYKSRKNHKLDEWSVGFINWIETLPYAKELIIGKEDK